MTRVAAGRAADESPVVDPVLRRLPGAAWRSLPALAVLGVAVVAAYVGAGWLLGPSSPLAWVAVGIVAAPAVAWAVDRMQGELFELDDRRPGVGRRLVVVWTCTLAPCLLAAWSSFVAAIADSSGSPYFQVLAVAGTVLVVVVALVAVVAIPVGTMRGDVRVRTIVVMSFLATIRRPLGPLAAIVVTVAVVWLGLTWFTGLLALAAPVFAVLAVAAAWPTVTAFGVALPSLTPQRRSTVVPVTPATQGEA
ncbi:hypothetical protein LQ757_15110 [Agromyces sp. SYSU K20354]|uniref:hypothetical protein n=1 Tax=Agromyces cavernae TaxID=2898659 RepID=UPI001E2EB423|nr:hypothetical protein [Agromyces cavernae]MCD2443607.1 hypothetical protein [Agromyces cavernae]